MNCYNGVCVYVCYIFLYVCLRSIPAVAVITVVARGSSVVAEL